MASLSYFFLDSKVKQRSSFQNLLCIQACFSRWGLWIGSQYNQCKEYQFGDEIDFEDINFRHNPNPSLLRQRYLNHSWIIY